MNSLAMVHSPLPYSSETSIIEGDNQWLSGWEAIFKEGRRNRPEQKIVVFSI